MKDIKIKGILAKDTTDWKITFAKEVNKFGCGVMWKDQMSNLEEIKDSLRKLISEQGYIDYYNIANNHSDYHCKIVDFATKEDYPSKVQKWENKNPAWFSKTFDEYVAGNQKAVIAFLVEDFGSIPPEKQIHIDKFNFYDKKPSVKNAVAYTDILTEENIKQQAMIDEIKQLLISNHNLILTGAPGTGKTYLAKQVAQRMIFGEIKKEMTDEEEKLFYEQCGFVQFHPSYDYTDFVEGLRPIQDDNGNVVFDRKDGVFKKFCKKAISSQKQNSVDNFNEAWDKLVNSLNENDFIDVPFISNKSKTFRVELNEYGTGLANRKYQNDDYQKGEWIKGHSKFFNKEQLYNTYRGMSGVPSRWFENYRKAIVNYMKENLGLINFQAGTIIEKKAPFIFIIDEINRGEISKIFGELFYSIDPGYRGKDGKVKTQYANMQEEPNDFDDALGIKESDNCGWFYVPENVYIIGTMNDIDRSVESMDFAFRRRFAFKEIKADKNVGMLDGLKWEDEAIKRMKRLNKAISDTEGLSSAYHIGASYFLKLNNYDGDFNQLWEYHLDGLLREYLRGMQNVEDSIKKLKNAYENANPNNGQ